MARGVVMTKEQLELTRNALIAKVKLDFSRSDVSYQSAGDVKTLGGYKVNTAESKKEAAKVAREQLGASIISVGAEQVAFVRRKDIK